MASDATSTRLSIDRPPDGPPPAVRDHVVVEGWAWSPEGSVDVSVTVGGRPAELLPGAWRPDVSAALGIGEIRGYVARATVTGLSPGLADVVVTATGPDGIAVERRRAVDVGGPDSDRNGRPRPWSGFTERLDPKIAPGSMTHAEHVARYRWVAQIASGREVLDAACGVGYGAHLLLAAGAAGVIGIDAFAGAIVEARERGRQGLRFEIGDLRELPLEDDRFDLVVCFEAIEHVAEQERVLDEVKRVLRPDGVLAISTPVRGAVGMHNPHHAAELSPDELDDLLRSRFANVELRWQHSALASLIDVGPSGATPAAPSPPMPWAAGPVEPLYVVALAGDGELPQPAPAGSLGAGSDMGGLITHAFALADELSEARAEIAVQRARATRAELAYAALEARHADALGLINALQAPRSAELPAALRAGGEILRDAVKRWQR
jgi:SAM-dependent methyltransferase